VGSRRGDALRQAVAKKLGVELAERGFCIVSGLARESTPRRTKRAVGRGKTAAVLAPGSTSSIPRRILDLYRRHCETGACCRISVRRRADASRLPCAIASWSGICEAVVVVESDVDGGAMITARFAGEHGKLIFAVPGRIDQPSSGLHQLNPRRSHAADGGGGHSGRAELS